MNWAALADSLLYVNLGWYVLLAVAFAMAGNIGKSVYFFGAAILAVGVILL